MWCDVMWCDVMWCDVMWCDVMWCDVMWCDVMWCDVTVTVSFGNWVHLNWTADQGTSCLYGVQHKAEWQEHCIMWHLGFSQMVMLKSHYAVYADIRNWNAVAAYFILLWGSPRGQQFAAPKHRYLYVNTHYCTSEEQNVPILWLWARQGSLPEQTAQPSMPQCPNTKFKASVYSSHSS